MLRLATRAQCRFAFASRGHSGTLAQATLRLRTALRELYAHYRRTEQMMTNILRDEETMPVVKEMFAGFRAYLKTAEETLTRGSHRRGGAARRARAATGHAVAFPTWRSLAREQGLNDSQPADLMCRLIAASAAMPS
jgi:hypothetical protein